MSSTLDLGPDNAAASLPRPFATGDQRRRKLLHGNKNRAIRLATRRCDVTAGRYCPAIARGRTSQWWDGSGVLGELCVARWTVHGPAG